MSSIKNKGAYDWNRNWHQNHSALIVPKAVEQFYVYGSSIEKTIQEHEDIYDFMLRAKVNRTSRLVARWEDEPDEELPRITRYFVSNYGPELIKIMPPTKRKVTKKMIKDWDDQLTDEMIEKINGFMQKIEPFKLADVGIQECDHTLKLVQDMQPREREIAIDKEFSVCPCNDSIPSIYSADINYNYYIDQAKKLII